jgi:hypothetical protein
VDAGAPTAGDWVDDGDGVVFTFAVGWVDECGLRTDAAGAA